MAAKFTAELQDVDTRFVSPVADRSGLTEGQAKQTGFEATGQLFKNLGEVGGMALEAGGMYSFDKDLKTVRDEAVTYEQEYNLAMDAPEVKALEKDFLRLKQAQDLGSKGGQYESRLKALYRNAVARYPNRRSEFDAMYSNVVGASASADAIDKGAAYGDSFMSGYESQIEMFQGHIDRAKALKLGPETFQTPEGMARYMKMNDLESRLAQSKQLQDALAAGLITPDQLPVGTSGRTVYDNAASFNIETNNTAFNSAVMIGLGPVFEAQGITPDNFMADPQKMWSVITSPQGMEAFNRLDANTRQSAIAQLDAVRSNIQQAFNTNTAMLNVPTDQKAAAIQASVANLDLLEGMLNGEDRETLLTRQINVQQQMFELEAQKSGAYNVAAVMGAAGIQVPDSLKLKVANELTELGMNVDTVVDDILSSASGTGEGGRTALSQLPAPQLSALVSQVVDELPDGFEQVSNLLVRSATSDPDKAATLLSIITSDNFKDQLSQMSPDQSDIVRVAAATMIDKASVSMRNKINQFKTAYPSVDVTLMRGTDGKIFIDVPPASELTIYEQREYRQAVQALRTSVFSKVTGSAIDAYDVIFGSTEDAISMVQKKLGDSVVYGRGFEVNGIKTEDLPVAAEPQADLGESMGNAPEGIEDGEYEIEGVKVKVVNGVAYEIS